MSLKLLSVALFVVLGVTIATSTHAQVYSNQDLNEQKERTYTELVDVLKEHVIWLQMHLVNKLSARVATLTAIVESK